MLNWHARWTDAGPSTGSALSGESVPLRSIPFLHHSAVMRLFQIEIRQVEVRRLEQPSSKTDASGSAKDLAFVESGESPLRSGKDESSKSDGHEPPEPA
jgi:hypothetical protein